MSINRSQLYRFPWSIADNPGAWLDVTDKCNLACQGCFRKTLVGHLPVQKIKEDVVQCQERLNCERIALAGGEPLLHPEIVQIVDFIARRGIKPVIVSNGVELTHRLACSLRDAGLVQMLVHVDSTQNRPGWEGKDERELNQLRQHYADLLWDVGGIQCGFDVTLSRKNLKFVPDIVAWCQDNFHKVAFLALIAMRGYLIDDHISYMVGDKKISPTAFSNSSTDLDELSLKTEEIYEVIKQHFPQYTPCGYLNGTADPKSYKFFVMVNIGSKNKIHGSLGAKTMELSQVMSHLFKGRYLMLTKSAKLGKKVFLMSLLDKEVRRAFFNFARWIARNPLRLLEDVYSQTIDIQQPSEVSEHGANTCDGCLNLTLYNGKLVNSCRIEEYRIFGEGVRPVVHKKAENQVVPLPIASQTGK